MGDIKQSVMVIGMSTPASLQVVRSLGANGIHVYGVGVNKNEISLRSKYLYKRILVKSYDIDECYEIIKWLILKYNIGCVIALGEVQINALNGHREDLERYTKLLFPDDEKMRLVLDKNETLKIADGLKLSIPKSVYIENHDDIKNIEQIPLPIIIKPSYRTFKSKIKRANDFRIKYYDNYDEAIKFLSNYVAHSFPCLVQEQCVGEEACLAFLRYKDKIIAHCQFEFVSLSDVPGIPSIKRAVKTSPELYEFGEKMLNEINWEGVALFDFIKKDKKSNYCLLEINGRFWGSTTLCSRAGVDFPYLLYRTVGMGEADIPNFTTIEGTTVINLCGETRNFLRKLLKNKNIKNYFNTSIDFLRSLYRYGHFEVQAWEDVMPGIIDIKQAVIGFLKKR